jgi:hypothetical protein
MREGDDNEFRVGEAMEFDRGAALSRWPAEFAVDVELQSATRTGGTHLLSDHGTRCRAEQYRAAVASEQARSGPRWGWGG